MTGLAPARPDEVAGARETVPSTVAWVLESALTGRREELRVGQQLWAPVAPITLDGAAGALRGLPAAAGAAWQLHPGEPEPDASRGTARFLRGRIEAITAVTAPHRPVAPGRWQAVPGRARTRSVDSTCAPDIARSVWIPSGSPVLIGFLVALTPFSVERQASTPQDPVRAFETEGGSGGRR